MRLAIFLYLTDFIHNIDSVVSFIMGFYIVSLIILIIIWVMSNDGYTEEGHAVVDKILKKFVSKWWVLVLSAMVAIVIPTQRTMYLMLGSVYLSESNLPSKVSQALELKLDDIIKEMKQGDKKKDSSHE